MALVEQILPPRMLAVPHYVAPCCYTIDPASGLVTSHFQKAVPEFPAEWITMEYAEDHVMQLTDVALAERDLDAYEATGGDPSSSPRWQANMTFGVDQEMIAFTHPQRRRSGSPWPIPQPDRPLFDGRRICLL